MTTVKSWMWDHLDSDDHGRLLDGRTARAVAELVGSLIVAGIAVACRAVVDRVGKRGA